MAENAESIPGMAESWIGRGSDALLRSAGRADVALLVVTATGLCTSGVLPFTVFAGQWPGSNLVGVLTIALVFCLLPATLSAAIGATVPRAGAEYVFTSRVLNGPLAFTSSWVFVLFSGLAAGSWVADLVRTTIQSFLRMFGLLLNLPSLIELSVSISQPGAVILVGTLIILLAYFTLMVPPRAFYRILWIGFLLAAAAWIVILIVFGFATPGAFQQGWDRFMGPNSFSQVIDTARSAGWTPDSDSQRMALVGMAVSFWVFFGYFVPTFFAAEVKKPERNLLTGSWLGLMLVWAFLSGAAYLLSRVAPADWLSADSFLRQAAASQGQAWLPFYVMVLAPSVPLVLLLFLAWLYTTINLVQVMMGYMSRILLAWADDGLLPAGMDYVHPRFRSPIITLLVSAVLVQIGLLNALLGGGWGSQFALPVIAALAMMAPVTAMTVFPYLKPEWYRAAPAFVRAQVGPLPLISLFGGISLFSLLWFIASSLIMGGSLGFMTWGDGLALAIFAGSGLAWYVGRRANLRAKGIQLADSFKYLH